MLSQLKLLLGITDTTKDALLNYLIKVAKDLALRTKNPYATSDEFARLVLPIELNYWVVSAAQQMYQMLGSEVVSSYSENGLSITYKDLQSGVSKELLNQIIPKAKAPM